jgi:uncharacterized protein (DUF1015 family)
MVSVKPFAGYRPITDLVSKIASPPYDVVNEDEARAFVAQQPKSFMRVIRPEVNLDGGSTYEQQHAEAKKQFAGMRAEGLFMKEQNPCFYLYRQSQGEHVQIGVVARCSVDDYEADRVKKHEHVRPAKVIDRTNNFLTVGAQTGPIFLTYRSHSAIETIIEKELQKAALYDFTDEVDVRHEVFQVEAVAELEEAFRLVPALYIADGHHRTASACAVRQARRRAGPVSDSDPCHGFLSVVFPEDQLHILAYNRLVKDLNGHSADELVAAILDRAPIVEGSPVPPAMKGHVAFHVGDQWRVVDISVLAPKGEDAAARPEETLDAHLLQEKILAPLLDIDDPRTNPRIFFWGGHRGPEMLAAAVADGRAAVVFALYPVAMTDIMDVSDADRVMPPKSTWFEPKLRSGLFVYDLMS